MKNCLVNLVFSTTAYGTEGYRIVLPVALCKRVVDLAHEGHQGLAKTKLLLIAKVWFPHMDRMLEKNIKRAFNCR